jgi:hypothetical protein
MKLKWIGFSLLALSLAFMTPTKAKAIAEPAVAAISQDRPWDAPPDEFRDVQRQGFHDGIEAAHRDFDQHRRADADDHEAFRHPPVTHDQRNDYRDGFRHGYERAMAHLRGDHDHDHD